MITAKEILRLTEEIQAKIFGFSGLKKWDLHDTKKSDVKKLTSIEDPGVRFYITTKPESYISLSDKETLKSNLPHFPKNSKLYFVLDLNRSGKEVINIKAPLAANLGKLTQVIAYEGDGVRVPVRGLKLGDVE